MINAAITIGFIGLVVFLGKHLFNVKDWGRYEPRRNDSGIVQGKYLPPCLSAGQTRNARTQGLL